MNDEQIKKACRRMVFEMIAQDRAVEAIEAGGIQLPPELRVDLLNTVWFMCGIPFDTWDDKRVPRKQRICLDWLVDEYVDLCKSPFELSDAAARYVDLLFKRRGLLYEKGLKPRHEIDEKDADEADAQNAQFRRTDGE